MNIKKLVAWIAWIGIVQLSSANCFGQPVAFRWKLAPGLQLAADITQEMEQSVAASAKPVTQNLSMQQTWTVDSVSPEGVAKISTVLDRVVMQMDVGAGSVELDTSKPDTEDTGLAKQLGQMFRPMIGLPCSNDMSPTGKITNVVVPPAALQGFRKLPLGSSMESMFIESIEKGSPVFPDEPLAPGKSWVQVAKNKTPVGNLESTTTYTYKGLADANPNGKTLHRFDTDTEMRFIGENRFNAKIAVSDQTIHGIMLFDIENGYLVSTEMDQDMTMTIEIPGQPVISNSTKQKMKTVFTPIEPKR